MLRSENNSATNLLRMDAPRCGVRGVDQRGVRQTIQHHDKDQLRAVP